MHCLDRIVKCLVSVLDLLFKLCLVVCICLLENCLSVCERCVEVCYLLFDVRLVCVDGFLKFSLCVVEVGLHCLDRIVKRLVSVLDLLFKLCLVVRVCRFKSRLSRVDKVSQVSHCTCKIVTGCCLEIGDRLLELSLNVVDLIIERGLGFRDLSLKLCLECIVARNSRRLSRINSRIQRGDLIGKLLVAVFDFRFEILLRLLQIALKLCDLCLESVLRVCYLALKRAVTRDSCSLSRINRVVQYIDRISKRIRIGGVRLLEIVDRLVQICLNFRNLCLQRRVCPFDLAVQLGLESRVCTGRRLLCIVNCLLELCYRIL